MPLRLLVGTEEWIVPYDGYTPRWQDLCEPKQSALDMHTSGACWQSLTGARQKGGCLCFGGYAGCGEVMGAPRRGH